MPHDDPRKPGARDRSAPVRVAREVYDTALELLSGFAFQVQVDRGGGVHSEWFSDGVVEVTGYEADELIAIGSRDALLHPHDVDVPGRQIERLLLGRPVALEYRIIHRSGSVRWLRERARPVVDPSTGRVPAIVGAVQDVTALHELSESLEHIERTEDAARQIESLALELNNVLAGILARTATAALFAPADARMHESVQRIEESVHRAARLGRELAGVGRRDPARPEEFALQQVIRDLLPVVGRTSPSGLRFRLEERSADSAVYGNPAQLRQVVLNVLLNAREAMPVGGEITVATRDVEVAADGEVAAQGCRPGRCLEMEIRDQGVGIASQHLTRIFDPGFTTRTTDGHEGMGLTTARDSVRDHGGAIVVESVVGRGTTVRVLLPMAAVTMPAAEERAIALDCSHTGRLLVADDEPLILDASAATLQAAGHEVVTVTGGNEAVEAFAEAPSRFDLVVLDMRMPGLDGSTCCEVMLSLDPDVKILVASGLPDTFSDRRMQSLGIVGWLRKPFTMDRLLVEVSRALAAPPTHDDG